MSNGKQNQPRVSNTESRQKKSEGGPKVRLTLNTLGNSRKTLSRIMRARAAGSMDREMFRDLCYGFEKLLQFQKLEQEIDIEKRLNALEERLALERRPHR